jgi:hypothetical protein
LTEALIRIGEIAKFTGVERIFHVGRQKLMTIPAFAWIYARVMAFRSCLETFAVWQAMLGAGRLVGICQGMYQVAKARGGLIERLNRGLTGDRLFTFTRRPPSQWRGARTTNAIERLLDQF